MRYVVFLLVLLVIPVFAGEFYVGELGAVFIFAVVGIAQMLLTGYTGLISLCHAAFLGLGAYTAAILLAMGVPFLLTIVAAAVVAGLAGTLIGLPTLRMSGLYLAIATLSFGSIIATVLAKWDRVTGGWSGFIVPTPVVLGHALGGPVWLYYMSLAALLFVLWMSLNILRSPIGRAMIAIRDSEISAQSMGIHLSRSKVTAFAISAGMAGLAGAFYAQYVRALTPDAFDLLISIQFITIIFVGGLGSLHGAIIGAVFVRLLPQAIALLRDDLPFGLGRMPGLEPGLFGLVLVLVILVEPGGVYGRWQKIARYLAAFPLSRRSTSTRQRSFTRSERLR
ncbi:branched-chain amino acid ABC transporter permease [Acidisphaera sp. L21]|uniref:branched-chain amino acid ABC transporter permease n=1 Tax=Acidisphaera sp. L21 TaxID=1641851 RepID=UPI00131E0A40|nr:branched-chain amino acid ABC transporter permease [Acidisphaera sp. L21]